MQRLAFCATLLWLALAGEASVQAQLQSLGDFPKLSSDQDWPWWRGPWRDGKTSASSIPIEFSESKNVRWKAEVPGRGHASPVIVGNQVFLTTADEAKQVQSVLAYDRSSGASLWKTDVNQGGFPKNNHPKNTEASPTLACDGERLYVTFFNHEQIQFSILDLSGKILSQQNVLGFNPRSFEYGYAPSPTLYEDSVIIAAEYDGASFIVAIDRRTGKLLWKTPRKDGITFSTPIVVNLAGRDQLLISGSLQVSSYDPKTGKALWQVDGTTSATCGTMVWDGDVVFASGGFPKAETLAVKADGSQKVLWRNNQKCYEQSMMAYQGHVYALTDRGIAFCWQASDGREMWQQRLKGPVSASPILVGDKIYWANELGTMYVFRATPDKFELLAENQLGDESFASPAAVGNQLFLRVASTTGGRRQEMLYCIQE
jgi:outer membrane protein assembly factor BamB